MHTTASRVNQGEYINTCDMLCMYSTCIQTLQTFKVYVALQPSDCIDMPNKCVFKNT